MLMLLTMMQWKYLVIIAIFMNVKTTMKANHSHSANVSSYDNSKDHSANRVAAKLMTAMMTMTNHLTHDTSQQL